MRALRLVPRLLVLLMVVGLWLSTAADGGARPDKGDGPAAEARRAYQAYRVVIDKTAAMASDHEAQTLAGRHKLQVLNLTWEDTGRFKNSAVGPNISDMTIQVQQLDPDTEKARVVCMPVIRFPNFEDRSGDVAMDKFLLRVGNEKGDKLRTISLRQYLGNFRKYLSKPASWKGDRTYLLADRDSHVLVSAQACFLPVPKKGIAEFNPVLFNYQSRKGDPAVLAILATREGTSATIIDNDRDRFVGQGGAWGQRLFHNHNGQRASLTGQRLSEFVPDPKEKPDPKDPPTPEVGKQKGLNMVLLIQVPLKTKPRPDLLADGAVPLMAPAAGKDKDKAAAREKSDVEEAVIGHGKVEGEFTEIDDQPIERDPRFPVRVTVQFYKATSNGVVSPEDLAEIARQIEQVYSEADFVGSLVTEGDTNRPTEHDGDKVEPPDWWERFWADYHNRTGWTREEAVARLREENGPGWVPLTERALADDAERLAVGGLQPLRLPSRVLVYVLIGAGVLAVGGVGYLLWRRRPGAASA